MWFESDVKDRREEEHINGNWDEFIVAQPYMKTRREHVVELVLRRISFLHKNNIELITAKSGHQSPSAVAAHCSL